MTNSPEAQPQGRDDYDLAYSIVEQMGLGVEFRNCSCGQLPCARLRPIVDALAKRETEVRADLLRATAKTTVEAALKELRENPSIAAYDLCWSEDRRAKQIMITVWPQDPNKEAVEYAAPSLADCMAQVRATRTEGEGEK